VRDQLGTGIAKLITANCRELIWGSAFLQSSRHASGVQVAGDFSGDEQNLTHARVPESLRRGLVTFAQCRARW